MINIAIMTIILQHLNVSKKHVHIKVTQCYMSNLFNFLKSTVDPLHQGLNCAGPLISRVFSSKYYNTAQSGVGWIHECGTADTEETRIWKNCICGGLAISYM